MARGPATSDYAPHLQILKARLHVLQLESTVLIVQRRRILLADTEPASDDVGMLPSSPRHTVESHKVDAAESATTNAELTQGNAAVSEESSA
jgi:hypothetical protein